MKIAPHQIGMTALEKEMFQGTIARIQANRKDWEDKGPRAYEKRAAIARAAERARKLRQSWGGEF